MCQLMAENCKFLTLNSKTACHATSIHTHSRFFNRFLQLHDNLFKERLDSLHSWVRVTFIAPASGFDFQLENSLKTKFFFFFKPKNLHPMMPIFRAISQNILSLFFE